MNSMTMRWFLVVISVVSLLGASCSSNDDGDAPAGESPTATLGPELEPDDSPLSTLTVAADVGEFGKPIDASAAFADTAPQVTAIADAQAAGTVTLKWLQVPEEGDPQELFSHEVAVEPEQVAFSQGTSPGGWSRARVRRRPRCEPAYRGQAAHGVVGLGRQAGRRRDVGCADPAARRASCRTGRAVARHITGREVDALHARTVGLLDNPVMPMPDRRRPIPWPLF